VNLITHSKTRANPESNVALMTLSDLAVLVTLTTDTGKILAKLHQVCYGLLRISLLVFLETSVTEPHHIDWLRLREGNLTRLRLFR
jgi:hypothetical protein